VQSVAGCCCIAFQCYALFLFVLHRVPAKSEKPRAHFLKNDNVFLTMRILRESDLEAGTRHTCTHTHTHPPHTQTVHNSRSHTNTHAHTHTQYLRESDLEIQNRDALVACLQLENKSLLQQLSGMQQEQEDM